MKVTILMLSVDEAPLLAHSLPAALAQDAEVLVDRQRLDGRRPKTVADEHGARYMRCRERVSYCAAMNAGFAATRRGGASAPERRLRARRRASSPPRFRGCARPASARSRRS